MTEISCKDDRSGTSLGVPGVVNFVGGILGENQLGRKIAFSENLNMPSMKTQT